mgnify:CR=1 FL=1
MRKALGIAYIIIIIIGVIINISVNFTRERWIRQEYKGSEEISEIYIQGFNVQVIIVKDDAMNYTYIVNTSFKERSPPLVYTDKGVLKIKQAFGTITVKYRGNISAIYGSIDSGYITIIAINDKSLRIDFSVNNGNIDCFIANGNYSVALYVNSGNVNLKVIDSSLSGLINVETGNPNVFIKSPNGGSIEVNIIRGSFSFKGYGYLSNVTKREQGYYGFVYSDGNGISYSIKVVRGNLDLTAIKG